MFPFKEHDFYNSLGRRCGIAAIGNLFFSLRTDEKSFLRVSLSRIERAAAAPPDERQGGEEGCVLKMGNREAKRVESLNLKVAERKSNLGSRECESTHP